MYIIDTMHTLLLSKWIYFIIVFLLIIIITIVFIYNKYNFYKYHSGKHNNLHSKISHKNNKVVPKRTNEFLMREQKAEKALEKGEILALKGLSHVKRIQSNSKYKTTDKSKKIVGVAKSVGFWSRFIMGQKMNYIMARLGMQTNKQNNQGFWVNLIKAQDVGKGRGEGRGR